MSETRWLVVVLIGVAGCFRAPPTASVPTPLEVEGLHNVYRVSDRVLSGSGPEGEASFASLKALGVNTIISVDGATPDVAAARQQGLRYVHLPIGYDGIPRDTALKLARAVRDLPGPVYVHCHHGKHRGPAAAAAIQLCLDPTWKPTDAEQWLAKAGTDARYRGLIELPRTLMRPTADELERVSTDFHETAAVPDLIRSMVMLDERWDRIKAAKSAKWKPAIDHPDVDPPHEATQLAEQYRELQRLSDARKRGPDFVRMLGEAEQTAMRLEAALRAKPPDVGAADAAFQVSAGLCTKCHAAHRDNTPKR